MHRLVLMSLAMVYAPLALGQEVVTDYLVGEEVSDEGLEDALEAPVDDTDEPDYFGLSVGIKGGASGNYLLPAEVGGISASGALPFEDGGGGWGTAVGGYVEFRAIDQHLGLELNILGGSTKTRVKSHTTVSSKPTGRTAPRTFVPVVETLVVGFSVSLGIGPEWVIGNSADFVVEVIEGQDYVDSEVEAVLSGSLTAAAQVTSTSHRTLGSSFWFDPLRPTFATATTLASPAPISSGCLSKGQACLGSRRRPIWTCTSCWALVTSLDLNARTLAATCVDTLHTLARVSGVTS